MPPTASQPAASRPPAWRAMKTLEERLGHEFAEPRLLDLALCHTSWANDQQQSSKNNERLEFLGDAVLELCISQELYRRYPDAREGALTQMRSQLVNETTLASLARKIGLNNAIRLGNGEEQQGGRGKSSLLADAMEAVLAAVFLDCGFAGAQAVIHHLFDGFWPAAAPAPKAKDAKTRLQEVCHKLYGAHPAYRLLSETGPAHEKSYTVLLLLPNGKEYRASGSAHKRAEQEAAAMALADLAPD